MSRINHSVLCPSTPACSFLALGSSLASRSRFTPLVPDISLDSADILAHQIVPRAANELAGPSDLLCILTTSSYYKSYIHMRGSFQAPL